MAICVTDGMINMFNYNKENACCYFSSIYSMYTSI